MSEEKPNTVPKPITPLKTGLVRLKADTTGASANTTSNEEKIFCDRCGGEVYRMHAVWRCSVCGYKSDCCGW